MSRQIPEWIGASDDVAIPQRVKLRIFQRFGGVCPSCTRKLQPGKWAVDHVLALINGGQHRESNLQPLCTSPCHSAKTKTDVALKSKTYRRQLKAAGVKARKRTIPGRRFNGEPIPARWVER